MKPLKLCFTIIPVVQEFEKKNSRNRKLRSLRNKFYLMLIDIAVYNVLVKKRMMLIFYFGQLWEVTKDKDTKEQAFFWS